jgi:hypothetical protein
MGGNAKQHPVLLRRMTMLDVYMEFAIVLVLEQYQHGYSPFREDM